MPKLLEPPTRRSVRSSDLSRHSRDVFAAAERQPVRVTRRDGETLVLTTQTDFDSRDAALEVAAQLLAVSLTEEGTVADRIIGPFPWIALLDPADRSECIKEIIETARASFSVHRPERLLVELAAWRHTAEAVAAGWGRAEALEWREDSAPVARP